MFVRKAEKVRVNNAEVKACSLTSCTARLLVSSLKSICSASLAQPHSASRIRRSRSDKCSNMPSRRAPQVIAQELQEKEDNKETTDGKIGVEEGADASNSDNFWYSSQADKMGAEQVHIYLI